LYTENTVEKLQFFGLGRRFVREIEIKEVKLKGARRAEWR
jgi:hypothetical protein